MRKPNKKEEREKQKQERLGEVRKNNFGTEMKIIEYNSSSNIVVEFQDIYKFRTNAIYQQFENGEIKNPYDKVIFNVGFIGKGKYNSKNNGYIYNVWRKMLQRCYDAYCINKNLSYINCYVCKEWHNFQNFARWYEENEYNCNNEKLELDKDILCKGNKIYSPKTCMLVPKRVNSLFVKQRRHRGEYPIGVSYHYNKNKNWERLMVSCHIYENNRTKDKFLGYFITHSLRT